MAFVKACSLHWEVSRGHGKGSLSSLITHPNQYYELTREAVGGHQMEDMTDDKISQTSCE